MKPSYDIQSSLKRYRLLADGMTQQELADLVGVTRQTIHSIEKGKYNPSVSLGLLLAKVFGVPVEDLFHLAKREDDA